MGPRGPIVPGYEDLDRFGAEVADWLRAHVPPQWRDEMGGATETEALAFERRWFAQLRAGGIAVPHWPAEWGGGFSLPEQVVIFQELARADAPHLHSLYVSLYHAQATLEHAATAAQRAEHLPRILDGAVWCQGFSEPEAGSDLASLRTSARRDGDVYVVNGQKIWSSHAHLADWCLLLARTDPEAPLRRGISYFILDLQSPGIDIRPIDDQTGGQHFSEIFLTDVAVPAANRMGDENDGWRLAQTTLGAERGLTMVEHGERMAVAFGQLVEKFGTEVDGWRPADDAGLRRELARVGAQVGVLQGLTATLVEGLVARGSVGPEAAILKVYFSELMRRFADLGLRLGGPAELSHTPPTRAAPLQSGNWMFDYLHSWAWTIGAGTNEILRTQIAERVLGLPREPSAR
jgi:alkylation response protein AidB-like acyl-CoA dehydrogenase